MAEYSGDSIGSILNCMPEKINRILSPSREFFKPQKKRIKKSQDKPALKLMKTNKGVKCFGRKPQIIGTRKRNKGARKDEKTNTIIRSIEVLDCLNRLYEDTRDILICYFWEGNTQEEIAAMRQCSHQNISQIIQRACRKMSLWLNQEKKKPAITTSHCITLNTFMKEIIKETENGARSWENIFPGKIFQKESCKNA